MIQMLIRPAQATLIIMRQNKTLRDELYIDHGTNTFFVLRPPFGASHATRVLARHTIRDDPAVRSRLASVPRSGELPTDVRSQSVLLKPNPDDSYL